jgi:phosphoglycolate phosphatase-like HAD superfamily hydrolase
MKDNSKVISQSDSAIIIFDFDRTLCRLFNDAELTGLVNQLSAQGIVDISVKDHDPYAIWSEARSALLSNPSDSEAIQTEHEIRQFLGSAEREKAKSVEPYPGTLSFFRDTLPRTNFKAAIVSNNDHSAVEFALTRWQIRSQIESLNCRKLDTPVTDLKPSPKPILSIMNDLGIEHHANPEANPVVYIGDSLEDCQSCKNANVRFVACLTGNYQLDDFANYPVYGDIQSIGELEGFLMTH